MKLKPQIAHRGERDQLASDVDDFIRQMYGDVPSSDLREYLRLICEHISPVMTELRDSIERCDFPVAAGSSHKLRNMTSAVGAVKVSQSLLSLEQKLKASGRNETFVAIEEIGRTCHELTEILAALFERV